MMKIVSSLLLIQLACLVRGDVGWSEFGRQNRANANTPRRNRVIGLEAPVKSKTQDMIRREKSPSWSTEDSLEEMFEVSRATLELSMDMSFSMAMSMSMATSGPITIPSSSPVTSVPNPIPTPAPFPMGPPGSPTTTPPNQTRPPLPSFPNFTGRPAGDSNDTPPSTRPPSFQFPPAALVVPSTELQTPPPGFPSIELVSDSSISNPPTSEFLPISNCSSTSKIRLGDENDNSTTSVPLEMGYIAESDTSADEFVTELEEALIATAVFAIFGCSPDIGGIIPTTIILDETCDSTTNNDTDCYVMETSFVIWVEGPLELDIATFKSYNATYTAMRDNVYVDTIPDLVNVKYLSPSPLIVPPGLKDDENISPINADPKLTRDASASRWTIGASVASLMGGIVSIMVFVRSRRTRQRRHLLAEETTPWVSPGNDNAVM